MVRLHPATGWAAGRGMPRAMSRARRIPPESAPARVSRASVSPKSWRSRRARAQCGRYGHSGPPRSAGSPSRRLRSRPVPGTPSRCAAAPRAARRGCRGPRPRRARRSAQEGARGAGGWWSSRAVAARQREELPRLDGEVESRENRDRPMALREALHEDGRGMLTCLALERWGGETKGTSRSPVRNGMSIPVIEMTASGCRRTSLPRSRTDVRRRQVSPRSSCAPPD